MTGRHQRNPYVIPKIVEVRGRDMELLIVLPWLLIIAGAFYIVRYARSSIREVSTLMSVGFWMLSICAPAIVQAAAAAVFAPPMKVTSTVWTLIDVFGMDGGTAQFVAEVVWRTIGVGVGLLIALIVLRISHPRKGGVA
jgi:hypothetical protein